jgi:hypothetical protein
MVGESASMPTGNHPDGILSFSGKGTGAFCIREGQVDIVLIITICHLLAANQTPGY